MKKIVKMPALLLTFISIFTAACTTVQVSAAPAPTSTQCPATIESARCYRGQDENGAFYWIAIPQNWNQKLVVHAHGGPRRNAPQLDDSKADLERFSIMVRRGYAWIGSTYRRGGYGVRMAAADTDNSRQIFWNVFGKPQLTILHGQSWGGNVAAKASELYALAIDGSNNYDGVLLTNGVLGGGTSAYQFRADLRAVYQYYCHNMPLPNELQYPVWQGLPKDSPLTNRELRNRLNQCTGIELPTSQRSATQQSNLRNILSVTGIQESHIDNHLAWATFLFQDLVQLRLGGLNPFDNSQKVYVGSDDDAALNAGVERFSADSRATALLAYDADLSGLIVLPTISIHAINDPTANFAMEADYGRTVTAAGRAHLLLQIATNENNHERLSDTEYASVLDALDDWISSKTKPSANSVATKCESLIPSVSGGCYIRNN